MSMVFFTISLVTEKIGGRRMQFLSALFYTLDGINRPQFNPSSSKYSIAHNISTNMVKMSSSSGASSSFKTLFDFSKDSLGLYSEMICKVFYSLISFTSQILMKKLHAKLITFQNYKLFLRTLRDSGSFSNIARSNSFNRQQYG